MEKTNYHQVAFNKNCRKSLKLIHSCQTQEEAFELLKAHFGDNAQLNAKCYFAYNNLPAGNASQNKKQSED